MRPARVSVLRRNHVSNVIASHSSARAAVHGASSGTFFASDSRRAWARPTSARTTGLMRGIVPL